MSKYPYIGKSRTTPVTVLFTSRLSGFCFSSGKYSRCWNEAVFDAVTSEFLSCKKIEVNSPFESKLIQLAAFKAGGETRTGGKELVNTSAPFILISKDLQVTFEDEKSFFNACKMDGIKLPRFDDPSEFVFPELEHQIKHFDCVCTKFGGRCCIGNCNEWPKVGDDVIYNGDSERFEDIKGEVVKVIGRYSFEKINYITVKHRCRGVFAMTVGKWIKKPKTPEQELNDYLYELCLNHCDSKFQASEIAKKLMDECNITKKVKDND